MPCGPQCRTGPDFDPEFEGPSEADVARFGADFISCPNCTADVYDEAAMCPTCGHLIEDTAEASNAMIMSPALVGGIALVLVVGLLIAIL